MLKIRVTGWFDSALKDLLDNEPELEHAIKQRIKMNCLVLLKIQVLRF